MKRLSLIALLTAAMLTAGGIAWDRAARWWKRRSEQAEQAVIDAALAKRISLHDMAGQRRPLKVVLSELAARCDVPIYYSPRQLEQHFAFPSSPLDVPDAELPLETALRAILRKQNLTPVARHGKLRIVPSVEASTRFVTRVYPLPLGGPESTFPQDAERWKEILHGVIAPSSWSEHGGEGAMEAVPGALIIVQSEENHAEIRSLLARLERAAVEPHEVDEEAGLSADGRRIERALAQTASADFVDVPITEALQSLAVKYDVPILPHLQWLDDWDSLDKFRVTYCAREVRLRELLAGMLAKVSLGFYVEDDLIHVNTRSDCDSHARLAIDNAVDWMHLENEFGDAIFDSAVLSPGWLIGRRNEADQQPFANLAAELNEGMRLGRSGVRITLPASRGEENLRRALAQEITLAYHEQPLAKICDDLSERLDLPVVFNEDLMRSFRQELYPPVTCDLPPLPLHSALDLMLRQSSPQLHWREQDGALVIADWDAANWVRETTVLDLRELAATSDHRAQRCFDNLVQMLVMRQRRYRQGNDGGDENVDLRRLGHLLVITSTPRLIEHHARLIERLAEHESARSWRAERNVTTVEHIAPAWVDLEAHEAALAEKLREPAAIEAKGEPTTSILKRLSAEHRVPIFIDDFRTRGRGILLSKEVSLQLRDVSLGSAIHHLLKKCDEQLEFTVQHGVIWVSTVERVESRLLTRLYPIGDLVGGPQGTSGEQVQEALEGLAVLDSRVTFGGPALVQLGPSGDVLVVTQSLPGHLRTEEFFAFLRHDQIPADKQPKWWGEHFAREQALRADRKVAEATPLVGRTPGRIADELAAKSGLLVVSQRWMKDEPVDPGATPQRLSEVGYRLRIEDEALVLTAQPRFPEFQFFSQDVADLLAPRGPLASNELHSFLEEASGKHAETTPAWPALMATLPGRVIVQGSAERSSEVAKLLAFLRREIDHLPRAAAVQERDDPAETEQLAERFMAASDRAEQAYLAFVLRCARPPSQATWEKLIAFDDKLRRDNQPVLADQLHSAFIFWVDRYEESVPFLKRLHEATTGMWLRRVVSDRLDELRGDPFQTVLPEFRFDPRKSKPPRARDRAD